MDLDMSNTISEEDLEPFKEWLISQDYQIEPCMGEYEVLRWKTVKEGQPKPIIFKKIHNYGKLTINGEALQYYLDWKDGYE